MISLINCRNSRFLCTFPSDSFFDELSGQHVCAIKPANMFSKVSKSFIIWPVYVKVLSQQLQSRTSTNKWKTASFHGKATWRILATSLISLSYLLPKDTSSIFWPASGPLHVPSRFLEWSHLLTLPSDGHMALSLDSQRSLL